MAVPSNAASIRPIDYRGDTFSGYSSGDFFWPNMFNFICYNGTSTAFISDLVTPITAINKVKIHNGYSAYPFLPSAISENGWVAGPIYYADARGGGGVWGQGQTKVTSLGEVNIPSGINNEGRVIGQNYDNEKGFVWKGQKLDDFITLLPEAFRQQVRKINPNLISNLNQSDNSYVITFKAENLEGPGQGSWVSRDFRAEFTPNDTAEPVKLYQETVDDTWGSVSKIIDRKSVV